MTSENSRRSYGVGVAIRQVLADIDIQQPHRHHDDIVVTGRLKCANDVSERVRIADWHQYVAGPNVNLVGRDVGRKQQVEPVLRDTVVRRRRSSSRRKPQ